MYGTRAGSCVTRHLIRSYSEKVSEEASDILLIWKATKEGNSQTLGKRYFPHIVFWPLVGSFGLYKGSQEEDTTRRRLIYTASAVCFLGPALLTLFWVKAKNTFVNKLTLEKSTNILTFELSSFLPWSSRTRLYTVKDVIPTNLLPSGRDAPPVMRIYPSIVMTGKEGNSLYLFKGQGFRDRNTFGKLLQGTFN